MKHYLYLLGFLFIVSCSIPKDAEDSYAKAKKSGLVVGYINNPPYSFLSGNEASGNEVTLIKSFAKEKGLQIHFIYGSETQLIKLLEEYKIHVIIGGFNKKTIWKDKAGQTVTYNKKNCLLLPKGENELLFALDSFLNKNNKSNGY